jgi:processive 1,2-diacylglycerol beta-glucosyltransferase
VRHERAYFARQQIGLFQFIQANIPAGLIRQVAHFWHDAPPSAVVSVLPICNWLLERALHMACPGCPYLVIPVDYEEPHRSYWFDTRMDASYITPTHVLAGQAAAHGIAPERRIGVAGMPIDPLFYDPPALERAEALPRSGLDPARPTILVGFGGQGSVLVQQCAAQLDALGDAINAIFLCGRHQALYNYLAARPTPYRKLVLGFTPAPPASYYHMADIIVGKPGSMTITEALITRTTLLAIESRALAVVQRGNEAWLRRSGVGEVISIRDLPSAVRRIIGSGAPRAQIDREWHRGVFDMATVITRVAHGGHLHPDDGEQR